MFCMSEQEKYEQVGRLAEEYSRVKGELNHVSEKIERAAAGYKFAGNNFANLRLQDGWLTAANQVPGQKSLEDLLGYRELAEAFKRRDELTAEVGKVAIRLRALAPHLV
jgi:hypothetical protein